MSETQQHLQQYLSHSATAKFSLLRKSRTQRKPQTSRKSLTK